MTLEPKNICPCCKGTGYLFNPFFLWDIFIRFAKDKAWQICLHKSRSHPDPLERGSLKQELPDCASVRELFMYQPEFDGEKKRLLIVIDMDDYGRHPTEKN